MFNHGPFCICIRCQEELRRMYSLPDVSAAQPVRETEKETVFQGAGYSHFSFVKGMGFHVTTDIPGMKQGVPVKHTDDIEH